jgi:hypothetical protein
MQVVASEHLTRTKDVSKIGMSFRHKYGFNLRPRHRSHANIRRSEKTSKPVSMDHRDADIYNKGSSTCLAFLRTLLSLSFLDLAS